MTPLFIPQLMLQKKWLLSWDVNRLHMFNDVEIEL